MEKLLSFRNGQGIPGHTFQSFAPNLVFWLDPPQKSSGLFTAYKLDGTPMSTGLTRKAAAFATSHYLKAEQDGTLWENSTTIESAKMGVKL